VAASVEIGTNAAATGLPQGLLSPIGRPDLWPNLLRPGSPWTGVLGTYHCAHPFPPLGRCATDRPCRTRLARRASRPDGDEAQRGRAWVSSGMGAANARPRMDGLDEYAGKHATTTTIGGLIPCVLFYWTSKEKDPAAGARDPVKVDRGAATQRQPPRGGALFAQMSQLWTDPSRWAPSQSRIRMRSSSNIHKRFLSGS
jgi:hypothetical protein